MALAANDRDGSVAPLVAVHARLTMWRACDLARTGRYAEAEGLLRDPALGSRMPLVLDLLARIRAQQGDLTEAEALWREASSADPINESFRAALDRIRRLKQREAPSRFVTVSLCSLAVLAIAAAVWIFRPSDVRSAGTPVAIVTNPQSPPIVPPARAEEALFDVPFAIPGAVVETMGAELAVGFRSGLFTVGTRLRADARPALETLAGQLATARAPIVVTIVGFTDDLPMSSRARYRDNAELGLARATTVLAFLRRASDVDPGIFLLRTAGRLDPLLLKATNAFDRRTVEFRISRGRR